MLLDCEKVKIKDISNNENLFEVLENEGFNLPIISKHQDKSTVLLEDSEKINVGTTNTPKITFYATSLTPKQK